MFRGSVINPQALLAKIGKNQVEVYVFKYMRLLNQFNPTLTT
jgi:hypothetical protein